MYSDDSFSQADDLSDILLITQAIQYQQSLQQQQGESSCTRNPIHRERDTAQARLLDFMRCSIRALPI